MSDQPEGSLAAAANSAIGSLRSRRTEILENLFEDRKVPRWSSPELFVRFHPIPLTVVESAQKKIRAIQAAQGGNRQARRTSEASESVINIHVDLLVAADPSLYGIIDGRACTLTEVDTWVPVPVDADEIPTENADLVPLNSSVLGDTLGEGLDTARQIIKALYLTDGDIMATAMWLGDFSGYKNADADQEILGN